uniref:Cytochrome P450 2U1 n=1 Tax=Ciona savignyi TaxID=51511 RepID=H2ZIS7_CIOSA
PFTVNMLQSMMEEINVSISFTFLIVFLALYYWYRRPNNFPPGPRGLPLLGVIPFLGNHPERRMRKWSKKYGPVMSVRMGRQDWVVLGDYDTIHQGLVKQGTSFSGRPRIATLEQITEGHGLVFADYGDRWKRQRRFGLATLRGFGVGKRSMEDRITEEVAYLNDAIRSHDGNAFDIQSILSNAISNNICSIVMGQRFDYYDERFNEIMTKLSYGFNDPEVSLVRQILIFMPALVNAPYFSRMNAELMENVRAIIKLLREIVADHKALYDQDNHRDFIDAFLGEQKSENGSETFTDKQLLHYVRDLFIAGTETTTSTLRWSLLCLIHHPEIQEKLRKEILKVLGQEKTPAMENKPIMPYTCAFMQEVYRYRTLVPLNLTHMTNNDVNLNGYSIPKGTTISSNIWAVHNDPALWKDPSKFKPERHLDDKGNFVQSNHVIPFSVGPRHCLGEQLARMEFFIFLVSLVQKFEFLPDPNATDLPEINKGANGVAFVPLPYNMVARVV